MKLPVNESPTDRALRITAGGALLVGAGMLTGVFQIVLLIISLALLITGIVGFCGLYSLFGISTCPVKLSSISKKKRK